MKKVYAEIPVILNKIKINFKVRKIRAKFHNLPNVNGKIVRVIQLPKFLFRHKIIAGGASFLVALLIFMGLGIYRAYFMTSANLSNPKSGDSQIKIFTAKVQKPSIVSPSPSNSPSPSVDSVLGASDESNTSTASNTNSSEVSPVISEAPQPTDTPEPTEEPTDSSSSTSNSSGNSNCSTGTGVPNSWYSDVYPVSPISASKGSVSLTVNIRDCSINNVSSSSTLKISLSSGDPNTEVNGQALPVSITTQKGQASFSVSSQVTGTVALSIQDTTDSFSLTDTNNNTPSIVFNGSSANPTPTPNATVDPTPVPAVSPTTGSSPTLSPTP